MEQIRIFASMGYAKAAMGEERFTWPKMPNQYSKGINKANKIISNTR